MVRRARPASSSPSICAVPCRRPSSRTSDSRSSLRPTCRWMRPRLTPAASAMSRSGTRGPRAATWARAARRTAFRTPSRPVGRPVPGVLPTSSSSIVVRGSIPTPYTSVYSRSVVVCIQLVGRGIMQVTIGEHQIEFGPKRLSLAGPDADHAPAGYAHIRVRPVNPYIGAEISGVDLADPSPEQIAELMTALLERKVLFFRDQDHLTARQHHLTARPPRHFAAHWGELEVHPLLDRGEIPEVVHFDRGQENPGPEHIWHVDVSRQAHPPLGSVLRALSVPEVGGDTLWA